MGERKYKMDGIKDEIRFYSDRRGFWRITWTVGYMFVMVGWIMRSEGTFMGFIFAGIGLLSFIFGLSPIFHREGPLISANRKGISAFIGFEGGGQEMAIPWEHITDIRFEKRVRKSRAGSMPTSNTVLCFQINDPEMAAQSGSLFYRSYWKGDSRIRSGGQFFWHPEKNELDMINPPKGGFPALIQAIAKYDSRFKDVRYPHRKGLGGTFSYLIFDILLFMLVTGTCLAWATDRMYIYNNFFHLVEESGSDLKLPSPDRIMEVFNKPADG